MVTVRVFLFFNIHAIINLYPLRIGTMFTSHLTKYNFRNHPVRNLRHPVHCLTLQFIRN
jgi:hypothetical protein